MIFNYTIYWLAPLFSRIDFFLFIVQLDACGAAVSFFVVGYAFAFGGTSLVADGGGTTFVGNSNFFLMDTEDYAFFAYNSAFAAATVTIVAGTLAERCQMTAYFNYSVLLAGWVWPIIVRAIWSTEGFLSPFRSDPLWGSGMIDFAGGGVVHVTGGLTSLYAAMILGARRGRFENEEGEPLDEPKKIVGSSMALQVREYMAIFFWCLLYLASVDLTLLSSPIGLN